MSTQLAGPEMAARVAEKVMGFQWRLIPSAAARFLMPPDGAWGWEPERFALATGNEPLAADAYRFVPDYPGDMSVAWQVADELLSGDAALRFTRALMRETIPPGKFDATGSVLFVLRNLTPERICCAALEATEEVRQAAVNISDGPAAPWRTASDTT